MLQKRTKSRGRGSSEFSLSDQVANDANAVVDDASDHLVEFFDRLVVFRVDAGDPSRETIRQEHLSLGTVREHVQDSVRSLGEIEIDLFVRARMLRECGR